MSTRDEPWPPGTPCWVELGTTDVEGALAFYEAVLGWTTQPHGSDDGGPVACRVRGRDAAGVGPRLVPGLPPGWTTYLATADADATAAAASRAGGTVLLEPHDVADRGRAALLVDTQGAVVGVWQAGRHVGSTVVNEPGAPTWNEAAHADPVAGRAFYAEVFGVEFEELPSGGERFATFSAGDGRAVGGTGALPAPGLQPHWLTYFRVVDVDATVATARARRASVEAGPFDTAFGRMATLTDPWGATFAVMGGEPDDDPGPASGS